MIHQYTFLDIIFIVVTLFGDITVDLTSNKRKHRCYNNSKLSDRHEVTIGDKYNYIKIKKQ